MRTRWLVVIALVLLAANVGWLAWRDGASPFHRAPSPITPADGPATSLPARTDGSSAARATPPAGPTRSSPTGPPPPATSAAPAGAGSGAPLPAVSPAGLIVPVQGIAAGALQDTFGDARSGERVHEALDIMAPAGTPVLATADGRIEKLFTSDKGGLTIYQFEPSGTWCYYYAHLQAYAPGLIEGATMKRGDLLGFVGSTGNADPAAPHLHFAVFALTPEKQWWKGTAVNPYPLLHATPP